MVDQDRINILVVILFLLEEFVIFFGVNKVASSYLYNRLKYNGQKVLCILSKGREKKGPDRKRLHRTGGRELRISYTFVTSSVKRFKIN